MKVVILVLRFASRSTPAATGVGAGGRAGGGGWSAVAGAWWVLLQGRVDVQNETHTGWYLGRTIQVTIPNLKGLESIVNDIQVLQSG